ncbi:hypothetical protein LINPERHAP1_LOCUS21987 [Linum perenne]
MNNTTRELKLVFAYINMEVLFVIEMMWGLFTWNRLCFPDARIQGRSQDRVLYSSFSFFLFLALFHFSN